jgi:hypothetical protein
MKGKSSHVDDADFSSPLSAIISSCKIRMEGKGCYEEENDTTDTWCIVIEYLLSIAVEKSCLFSMGTQLEYFHLCSAKKSGNEVQLSNEIELHSENSVIA